jgi:hypothetical protein
LRLPYFRYVVAIPVLALFSGFALGDVGYTFQGDLNGDGIPDSIMSGPSELFGNAGGPFIVSLSSSNEGFMREEVFLHPKAAALEVVPGHYRLWAYHRLGCCEGTLNITTLDGNFHTSSIQLYFTGNRDSLSPSEEAYRAIFSGRSLLQFKMVENYQVPPPLHGEWGK